MATTEIILLIVWFLIYIMFSRVHRALGHFLTFVTFIFAYVVSDPKFATFYLFLPLIAMGLDLVIPQIETTTQQAPQSTQQTAVRSSGLRLEGFGFIALQLIAGLVIYLMIQTLSRAAGGNIIGVPDLAISAPVGKVFKPVFEASLGVNENLLTFVFFDILLVFGRMIPLIGIAIGALGFLIPMLIAAGIMALFHVVAYSVAISLILYALGAFALFIASRMMFNDTLAADTAHFLNNALISISRGLQVVR